MFDGGTVGGITNVAHGHDGMPQHLLGRIVHSVLYELCIGLPVKHDLQQKIDHAGMLGYAPQHVAEFEVAMRIYKTGTKPTLEVLYFAAGLLQRHYVNNGALCIGNNGVLDKHGFTGKNDIGSKTLVLHAAGFGQMNEAQKNDSRRYGQQIVLQMVVDDWNLSTILLINFNPT